MKKSCFLFSFLITCVITCNAQESLILKFFGYDDDPLKTEYIRHNLSGLTGEAHDNEINFLSNHYVINKKDILNDIDILNHKSYLKKIEAKNNVAKQHQAQRNEALIGAVLEGVVQGVEVIQQQNALRKQEEAAIKAQTQEQLQALTAQNKQKYAAFQAMTNNKAYNSNYMSNKSSYNTKNSYSVDIEKNRAKQMSNQAYGTTATNSALNQQRASYYQSNLTGGYGGTVISAVTSNRQAIKIQVSNADIGGRVIAYSLGGNYAGQQQWAPADGIISKCTSNMEYQYTSYISGIGNIFF